MPLPKLKKKKRKPKERVYKNKLIIERDWFNPRKLYDKGVPSPLTCHFDQYPESKKYIRNLVKKQNPKNALEIGPGSHPILSHTKDRIYLDITKQFLKTKKGDRIEGTVEALPFQNKKFDIIVMNDVLSHVPPRRRKKALTELARVGNKILILEEVALSKTPKGFHKVKSFDVKGINVNLNSVSKQLNEQGFDVSVQKEVLHQASSFYDFPAEKGTPTKNIKYKEIRYILLATPKRKTKKN